MTNADKDVTLRRPNVDMLVSYVESLTPPAAPVVGHLDNMTAAYHEGYATARAAARRLVLDMWAAAEIAHYAELQDRIAAALAGGV